MNLAGPMEMTSADGKKYFLIIVNDYSHGNWIESLTFKSETVPNVQEFIRHFKTGYDVKVHTIMANNGTEFVNIDMQCFLRSKVITLYTSIPYTHEQNSVTEQAIHTITKGVHAMLYVSKLPKNLWSVVVKVMAYLHNRSPTQADNGVMLLEHIIGENPDLTHLRIFGSPVSIAVPKEKCKKWDDRSGMGYMVGYEPYPSSYLVCYPGA